MWKDQCTAEQIALVLMEGALGFEYYMQEEFRLYDLGPDDASPMSKPPEWVNHADRLREWCQERICAGPRRMGAGNLRRPAHPGRFPSGRPAARECSGTGERQGRVPRSDDRPGVEGLCRIRERGGRELADELRGEVETDLREAWGVDVRAGHRQAGAGRSASASGARRRGNGAGGSNCSRGRRCGRRSPRIRSPASPAIRRHMARPVVPLPGQGLRPVCPPCGPDGLHCPKCEYRRDWAWSWMADWSWRRRWDEGQ